MDKLYKKDVLFTKKEAAEILGLTPRTIHYYSDEGLVEPEVNPKGKGTTRKYSRYNLFEFLLIKELAANGLDLKTIKDTMKTAGFRNIGPGKELIVLYDARTDHGKLVHTSADANNEYKVKMEGRSSAILIDLTGLRKKVLDNT